MSLANVKQRIANAIRTLEDLKKKILTGATHDEITAAHDKLTADLSAAHAAAHEPIEAPKVINAPVIKSTLVKDLPSKQGDVSSITGQANTPEGLKNQK